MTIESRFATELAELAVPFTPMTFPEAQTLIVNEPLAEELGLDVDWLRSEEGSRWLTGADTTPGSRPVAQLYAGHQFGVYSPRLGDGRAVLLGELSTTAHQYVDVHLKGSGRTPFSRGDGFAAVGPMLREFLIGEAMHALGIPSSRALAVTATGRYVTREGDVLPGAVLTRTATSHIRVGTFAYARATGDDDLLARLVTFALERHEPDLIAESTRDSVRNLLRYTIDRQAQLVSSWMLVGFVHGVLNTDNVLISGEGFDYGPCAFMDAYDPLTVFSSIDQFGRYAYGRQPSITHWNLTRFAETLIPLLDDDEDRAIDTARRELGRFSERYNRAYRAGLSNKLGGVDVPDPETFFLGLQAARADFTTTFRMLASLVRGQTDDVPGVNQGWLDSWLALDPDPNLMDRVNPVVIPRNHRVEEALDAAVAGDLAPFEALLVAVRRPYAVNERFAEPPPANFGRYVTFCGT